MAALFTVSVGGPWLLTFDPKPADIVHVPFNDLRAVSGDGWYTTAVVVQAQGAIRGEAA